MTMETLGTIALLLLIGWQVIALRKDVGSLTYGQLSSI